MMAPITEEQTVAMLRNVLDSSPASAGSWDDVLRGRSRVRRRHAMVVSLVAIVALVAGVALAVTAARPSTDRLTELTNSGTVQLAVTAHVDSDQSYAALAVGGGSVFAADWSTGYLIRYNASTLRPTGRLLVGGQSNSILSLAYGYGSVWAVDFSTNALLRIDPHTLTVIARIPGGRGQMSNVAVGNHSVMVTVCCMSSDPADRQGFLRVDPSNNDIAYLATFAGSGQSLQAAVGEWTAVSGESGPIYVSTPGPPGIRSMANPGESPASIAAVDGQLYALTRDNAIVRLDVNDGREPVVMSALGDNRTTNSVRVDHALTSDGHNLWLATDRDVLRFDPATRSITAYGAINDVGDLVATPTAVYVSRSHDIERLAAR
jgi:streptogramin lyase